MTRCSICYEQFDKKCMSISKKDFSSEDEHKKWKHFIFEISLYFFRHTYGCLVFYCNELLITEAYKYGNRSQKVFQKQLLLKQLSKIVMSQKDSRMIIKIKSNPLRIHFYISVSLQTRETMFRRKVFQRIILVSVSSSI